METTRQYANIFRQLRYAGTPIPTNDIWIAALVIQHELALYSRDAHFDSLPQLRRIG
jgi:predicted nucleic acid-binding protein